METKKYEIIANQHKALLISYLPDVYPELIEKNPKTTFIICPGGGYQMVSDREGEPIALQLVSKNYNAFVLKYSVGPNVHYPTALLQLAQSIAFIREHAAEFHVDPQKMILCGFSAGGHLASLYSTTWKTVVKEMTNLPEALLRPNGLMLAYPVITTGPFISRPSFEALLGEDFHNPQKITLVSTEKLVNVDVPPTFLWHTQEDEVVPCENSILFLEALRKNNIPCEFHLFPKGCHGLSLATPMTNLNQEQVAQWLPLFLTWVEVNF